jgi:hypothetical protein
MEATYTITFKWMKEKEAVKPKAKIRLMRSPSTKKTLL